MPNNINEVTESMKDMKTYSTKNLLKRFIVFLKPYKILVFLFLLVSVINIFTSISEGYLIKGIVNFALKKNSSGIIRYILFMMVIIVVGVCTSYLLQYLYGLFSSNAMRDFRLSLYRHFQKLPISFLETRHSGDLLSRFTNDSSSVQDFFGQDLLNLFTDILQLAAVAAYLMTISWNLLLFSIMLTPLALFLVNFIANYIKRYSRLNHEAIGKANIIVQDAVNGIQMVKSFNLEDDVSKMYEAEMKTSLKFAIKETRINSYTSPLHVTLRTMPLVLCVTYGSYLVINKSISTGDLMAFIYLIGYIYWPLAFLTDKISKLKSTAGASERVAEVYDWETECEVGTGIDTAESSTAIEFKNVTFGYKEEEKVLQGLSFSIEKGKKAAIVGLSGCGKSTLLKLICGIQSPESGTVEVLGKELDDISISKLRSEISLVTQDNFLYPVSVLENISYGKPEATYEEIVSASKIANAYEFIQNLPEGFQTIAGERGIRLSGGQKQRIALARAVLKNSPILLLDEPTSALDTESEALVQEALDKMMTNKTVVIVAHRFSTIKSADEIIVLNEGKISERGTHDELICLNGDYKRLYEKQFNS